MNARDLLRIGIVVLGIWFAVSSLPTLLQSLGIAVYYAEGSRREYAGPRFDNLLPDVIREGLRFLTGCGLAMLADSITDRLGAKPPIAG